MKENETSTVSETLHVQGMYENYFLEYASYVITERAVPYLEDGLKPVQRRILHSLFEVNDGRFHKAANVIGNTMKYHPHGDAAIGDALVHVAQKGLLIETQGNWGDPTTGDSAAAPRYIECKLSPFALEIAFNKRTTEWVGSYDGRNQEPVALPVKFPLLLAQGAEGIAVGLATKILPHNFVELLKGSIKILQNKSFQLYPDFPTGGSADVSDYKDGKSGGKVKVRATIEEGEKRTLIIREVPYGVTTSSLIDSIVSANDKGKIKIRKIEDNTAKDVEIVIHLPVGVEPEMVKKSLYAFTDCEVSLSSNVCIIRDKKPLFIGVKEVLKENVQDTTRLIKTELEIKKSDLEEKWHMRSLEKIFIEERIYRKIENCETWESIIQTIRKGLKPFEKTFIRAVTDEDIERLTEIKIKRISRFDALKAEEELMALNKAIKEVKKNLKNLVDYVIAYYENLLKKYGKDRKRKTKLDSFEEIQASSVILSNLKVGYDSKTGFIGTSVKGDGVIPDCSKMDDLVVFTEEGTMVVTKVGDKKYVGKGILHADKFEKNNPDIVYNMVFRDGRQGSVYVKRFTTGGVTRDKHYPITRGTDNSKIFYFSVSGRDTKEVALVKHVPKPRIKKEVPVPFQEFDIKGRGTGGVVLTKHSVRSAVLKKGTAPSVPKRLAESVNEVSKENASPSKKKAATKKAVKKKSQKKR
jgi:topoisomerase-4 subunit A